MNKILSIKKAIKIAENIRKQGKSIVLVGGCFDILHIGHIRFLQAAKQKGDVLIVLLESDETTGKMKGKNRPVNPHHIRAEVLAALESVNYVVLLPPLCKDIDYDAIIGGIKPDIIATTKNDPNRRHKERQAKLVDAKVIDVIKRISKKSTTRIARLLAKAR